MPTILAERPLLAPITESADLAGHPKKKRGPKPKLIVEFPDATGEEWIDPPSFPEALALHMRRHGDSCNHLHRAIIGPGDKTDRKTIQTWATGLKAPGTIESLSVLSRIERRYRLPEGYFQAKLDRTGRATARPGIAALTASERRKLAWHLPGDFSKRPKREREEILAWVRSVIIEGATEYRRFQREATQQRFSLRFPDNASVDVGAIEGSMAGCRDAPLHLQKEVHSLIAFKTSTLAPSGLLRQGMWGEEILLGGAEDPKTFFVKSAKLTTKDAAYSQVGFYDAWRLAIQRYGIYNPYTGLGAIKGLLPHGPHNVRDVLATHVLKKTGSYEQAGYAIQDSPEIVAKHYGRFFPHDKSALAAVVLNEAWES